MPPLLELLDREERWTQGVYATDALGYTVDLRSAAACRWCLSGGLLHCYTNDASYLAAERKLIEAFRRLHPDYMLGLAAWQDKKGRTLAEIRQLLEEAATV